jgi:6-phosphofructokinase 1
MHDDIFHIDRLGACTVPSPINLGTAAGDRLADFTADDARVVADLDLCSIEKHAAQGKAPPAMEVAGPRRNIYFDPSKLKAGIVTCGGLCPGLNDVIRGLVMTLHYGYGVPSIFGFRYGYAGLIPKYHYPVMELTPESVMDIHKAGGTILGTSRGQQDVGGMVDALERMNVGLLFVIGGDGTFRGGLALYEEIMRRGVKIGVVGVPKTIDNDIPHVDLTFGFRTAVAEASHAIQAAYYEATSARHGIGLVKLMGRHSGFIAANAALANRNVNLVLVPEVRFDLEGENGMYGYLEKRFRKHKSTVIVVAEGAGQELMAATNKTDASGNVKLSDIGAFLKQEITGHFEGREEFTLKYIDPSYIIRSAPASPVDSIFCGYLAQAASHAGMAGKTGMAVGRSHGRFTHIPIKSLVSGRKQVDPESDLWLSVLESTGQPFYLQNEPPKRLSRASMAPEDAKAGSGEF